MNLSSVLIVAKQEYQEELCKQINATSKCSVELCEGDKMIVIIESETLEEELNAFKNLEKLSNVISINMVFSYQDLDDDIQKAINSGAIKTIEKKEKAENITYYGSIFNKFS